MKNTILIISNICLLIAFWWLVYEDSKLLHCTQKVLEDWVEMSCEAPDVFETDQRIEFVVNEMSWKGLK